MGVWLDLGAMARNNSRNSVNLEAAPENLLDFIDRHIESVEQLEILLLLNGDQREWQFGEIFRRIQSSEASVQQRLKQLVSAGLVVQENDEYRFQPTQESMRTLVAELAAWYRERRVRVIEAIYTRRTDAVQTFANAFKFRRKE